jgi:hypothetical protein
MARLFHGVQAVVARSKSDTTVAFGGLPKTGACHRFDGGRNSTGISILRIDNLRSLAAKSRRNECLSPRGRNSLR